MREANLPLFNEPDHPRFGEYEHQHTKDWSAIVSRADAFIFVVPEYNYGFNAAVKNAIDYLHNEWRGMPVGFVSHGRVAAGTRAVQMLKQVVTTLKVVPIPESVSIAFVRARYLDGRARSHPPASQGRHSLRRPALTSCPGCSENVSGTTDETGSRAHPGNGERAATSRTAN